jgi:hypothetical protein
MLSAALLGGLSNQIFQIAAVQSLALDNNDECAFPFDRTIMGEGCHVARRYIKNIFREVKELPASWKPEFTYKEPYVNGLPSLNYQPIPYRPNMQVIGYFPSEKYFLKNKKKIVTMFKDYNIIHSLLEDYSSILPNSVSVHVRRGDYRQNASFFVVQSKNYYTRALNYIDKKTQVEHILVFSDDIPWCKRNLADKRMIFIENQPDYKDIFLMSLCTHNIIANSGFSWWGAYFNENKDKIVCAPERWFGSSGVKGYTDQYLKEMIIL